MNIGQNSLKTPPVWAYQGEMTCEPMVRRQRRLGERATAPLLNATQEIGEGEGSCYGNDRGQYCCRPVCGAGGCRPRATDPPARAAAPGRPLRRSPGRPPAPEIGSTATARSEPGDDCRVYCTR